MPAQPDDPQWLKDAYAEGRVMSERTIATLGDSEVEFVQVTTTDQSETVFEGHVVEYARLRGWKVMAVRRNVCVQRADGTTHRCTPWLYDGEGWVDLVLVRDRVVHAELKSESGRVMPEQKVWHDRLKKAGAEVYLWRPRDWPEIEKVLK